MSLISASGSRTLALAGLSGLALLTGCGSSGGSGSSSTPAASTPAASTPAASTSTPAAASGGAVAITYKDYSIDPAQVTVKAGTKITWTSKDPTVHNVVFKDGDPEKFTSKDLKQGQSATFTPTKPGVYKYLCTFHAASMQGTLTVTG